MTGEKVEKLHRNQKKSAGLRTPRRPELMPKLQSLLRLLHCHRQRFRARNRDRIAEMKFFHTLRVLGTNGHVFASRSLHKSMRVAAWIEFIFDLFIG